MKCFFFLLAILFSFQKIEALDYQMLENAVLKSSEETINLSTKSLDALVEKMTYPICTLSLTSKERDMLTYFEALEAWWYQEIFGYGNGFFITPKGHFLTCKHVSKLCWDPIIYSNCSDHPLKVSIIAEHPIEDIALLKVEGRQESDFPYLKLSSSTPQVGNWIFSIYSSGPCISSNHLLLLPFVGKILGYDGWSNSTKDEFFLLSPCVFPGASGSPIANFEGDVVGISAMLGLAETGPGTLSGAVPIHKVKDWIKEVLRADGYDLEE
ncbi:MAG: serine protease [Chlamydiae bacterium]|nr:serine protease [Chlamydiota bacterium]